MKGKSTAAEIRDVLGGDIPLRKIFTKEQKAFFTAHAPPGIAMDQLVPLGPTFILKLVWFPKELNRQFVAELWLYQDGSRILELSTKCLPGETFQVAAEARGVPREVRHHRRRRAADEDPDRARVLPRGAVGGGEASARSRAAAWEHDARPHDHRNPHDPVDPRAAGQRDGGGLDRDAVDGGRVGHGGRRDGGDSGSDRDGSPTGDGRRHEDDARRLDDPACRDAAEGVDLEGIDCKADDPEGAGAEDRRDHAPDAPPERLIGLRTRTRREPAGIPVGSLNSRQIAGR